LLAAIDNSADAIEELRAMLPELIEIAEAGGVDSSEAAFVLGAAYMNVFDEDASAVGWFERAGEHAGALRSLGYLVDCGRGVQASGERTADLYQRAAVLGDPFAQFNLGLCYKKGSGRPIDRARAKHWYRAAAEQGMVDAMSLLGDMLNEDDEDVEARSWYVRAAEAGHAGAVRAAADWYREGLGGERDLVQAVHWYFRLLALGEGDGIHEIHELMSEMSDEEIKAAAKMAGDPSLADAAIEAWPHKRRKET
jgi:TPR repeat protein